MLQNLEALKILRDNCIPYNLAKAEGFTALFRKSEVNADQLRRLGFRISNLIGSQWVVSYQGGRVGLII